MKERIATIPPQNSDEPHSGIAVGVRPHQLVRRIRLGAVIERSDGETAAADRLRDASGTCAHITIDARECRFVFHSARSLCQRRGSCGSVVCLLSSFYREHLRKPLVPLSPIALLAQGHGCSEEPVTLAACHEVPYISTGARFIAARIRRACFSWQFGFKP